MWWQSLELAVGSRRGSDFSANLAWALGNLGIFFTYLLLVHD